MKSGNAFRDGAHPDAVRTTNSNGEDAGHAHKRLKTSPKEATILTKIGDLELALEVDHMILDHLSSQTIQAVLASRVSGQPDQAGPQQQIATVDAFLAMFKAKHPNYRPDAELRFRLLLLRFTVLFCQRLVRVPSVPSHAALLELREQNAARARHWIGDFERIPSAGHDMSLFDAELPLPLEDLETNRAHVLHALKMPAEDDAYDDAFYGTKAGVSLLDVLPMFMSVVAACNELYNISLNERTMELLAEFMLQACLEQYLVHGANGSDPVDEAFAWGRMLGAAIGMENSNGDIPRTEDSSAAIDETLRMFEDDGDCTKEIPGWSTIRSKYIKMIIQTASSGLINHLERIAKVYPIKDFESLLLAFLTDISASLPEPILTQLEKGRLDNMTSTETAAFLQSCGLDSQWPNVASR